MSTHYVYYLHDPTSLDLLYIGRSNNPASRQKDFVRLHGIQVLLGICQRHSSLEAASAAELVAIAKHWPPFNKHLVSVPGGFHCKGKPKSEEHRKKIGLATKGNKGRTGKVNSPEHREAIRKAQTGNKHWLGKKHSEETKAKIKASTLLAKSLKIH